MAEHIKAPNASGAFLRDTRLRLGMSQTEAAWAIGCSVSSLGRYERSGIPAGILVGRAFRICKAYGISTDKLFGLACTEA